MAEVLVVGASGLVGTAAIHAFAAAGWAVVASSRRRPAFADDGTYRFLALDLRDAAACRAACAELDEVTHVVYTAVHELPGLVPGWTQDAHVQTNGAMLQNLLEPLCQTAELSHVTILQGTKAYGALVRPMRVPAREDQPRVEHPNFYWLHEDYVKQKSAARGFAYTILRPQMIYGPNVGVAMNPLPVLGIYAAIRRHEGLPFSYPGGADWVWEAVDARLVANACLWAATHAQAHGEIFNLTNGEVFTWRDAWPRLAAALGVEPGPAEPLRLAEYLPARAHVWDAVVAAHDLQPIPLESLLGESHHYADLTLAAGLQRPPPPTFVSTVKIKQAGFTETCNTEQSFVRWLRALQDRKILPPPVTSGR